MALEQPLGSANQYYPVSAKRPPAKSRWVGLRLKVAGSGSTGCGKTLVYRRVLHLRRNFSPFRPFSLRISVVVLRLYRSFYRHPGTLRPYWASNSIEISLLMRVKLCAAMLNFQNQFTRSRPRSFTCRAGRSSFDQPKTRSIEPLAKIRAQRDL